MAWIDISKSFLAVVRASFAFVLVVFVSMGFGAHNAALGGSSLESHRVNIGKTLWQPIRGPSWLNCAYDVGTQASWYYGREEIGSALKDALSPDFSCTSFSSRKEPKLKDPVDPVSLQEQQPFKKLDLRKLLHEVESFQIVGADGAGSFQEQRRLRDLARSKGYDDVWNTALYGTDGAGSFQEQRPLRDLARSKGYDDVWTEALYGTDGAGSFQEQRPLRFQKWMPGFDVNQDIPVEQQMWPGSTSIVGPYLQLASAGLLSGVALGWDTGARLDPLSSFDLR